MSYYRSCRPEFKVIFLVDCLIVVREESVTRLTHHILIMNCSEHHEMVWTHIIELWLVIWDAVFAKKHLYACWCYVYFPISLHLRRLGILMVLLVLALFEQDCLFHYQHRWGMEQEWRYSLYSTSKLYYY